MWRSTGSPGHRSASAVSSRRRVVSRDTIAVRMFATRRGSGTPGGVSTISGAACSGGLIGEGSSLAAAGSCVASRIEVGGEASAPEARHCSSRSSIRALDAMGLAICSCEGGLDDAFASEVRAEADMCGPRSGSKLALVIIKLQDSASPSSPNAGSMPVCRVRPGASCHMTASWSHESSRTVSSSMPNSRALLSGFMDSATCFQNACTAEVSAMCRSTSAKARAVMVFPLDASSCASAVSRSLSSSATQLCAGAAAGAAASASTWLGQATRRATSP
mmetsp:Transcript_24485/g.73068  ORF Transcript_24485/g.73068 Transcript_24485/m.73068 type:complete len:276 (+) Transcript_24485:664-1491(+)